LRESFEGWRFATTGRVTRGYAFDALAGTFPTLLDLIGSTPVVRLAKLGSEYGCTLLAKLEFLNPGGSNKDRIGLAMVEEAERSEKLRPGGTIVEPTSGNTGVGLALAAAVRGYKLICVVPDKVAPEKIALLRAFGAEVVICPTAVDPDSPESYYSVSDRLAEEIPGAYKPDQYSNDENPAAHYESTGPEIWEQVGDALDILVISVGTGGSITGAGRYLKERKPDLVVVGADPEGSVFTATGPEGIHPYLVEGIGKDSFPDTFDPAIVDEYVRVSDRDSFLTARRLAREEGILGGGSGGTSVHAMLEMAERHGPGKTILTTIPDGGRGYLSKLYDDNWMLEHGMLERRSSLPTIAEVLRFKHAIDGAPPDFVVCEAQENVAHAIELMQRYGISQVPVVRHRPATAVEDVIGSLTERGLLDRVLRDPDSLQADVASVMGPPLPAVEVGDSIRDAYAHLATGAAVVSDRGRPTAVVSRSDLLEYLAHAP
jgi:cystathionine beta-synthase